MGFPLGVDVDFAPEDGLEDLLRKSGKAFFILRNDSGFRRGRHRQEVPGGGEVNAGGSLGLLVLVQNSAGIVTVAKIFVSQQIVGLPDPGEDACRKIVFSVGHRPFSAVYD